MTEFRVVGTGVDRRLSEGETTVILAGIQGPAGNSFGFRWRGAWASGTQYQKDDAVYNAADMKPYICVVPVSVASAPPSADWSVMAEDGAAAVATHVAQADPHVQYQRESEKAQANGYASLDGGGTVPDAQIPSTITRDTELDAHVTDATAAHAASAISNAPAGAIAATTVQAAIDELDAEKQALSAKDAANGYSGLDANARIATARLGTGTANATAVLGGDQTWKQAVLVLRFGGGRENPSTGTAFIVGRSPVAGTVTKVYGIVVGGTSVAMNAKVGASSLRSADLTVNAGAGWSDFGTLQNTTVAAGDAFEIDFVTVTGVVTWAAIQIEVTP